MLASTLSHGRDVFSRSSLVASAHFGMDEWCSKMDLRTRAIPEGVSRLPIQSTEFADAAYW
ncbi:hypothetical protein [Pullulanibacillus pueri]|uniref:Uncharacterized protein n=1 Tax=Pullulanibacillus pueri TaxID=1437324 RepID=A0A8J2ZZ52_9BACL|nr:hypothetical protein [Pullulanibacillus pueri]GGH87040.1 hypothetical protein GCM10007096_36140 [Pullulanibacillus pueri]